ncbi:hypothetical protein NKT77_10335 [Moraxella sp. FZLJ2107]|uniref:hypothetical protein n=1 Tax=unclassified Moraxella TaxID=2685852 RepID=UPI00209BD570|nr:MULTISPECIES: hypothetical protein [unclassified Moraxella]USZ14219.1 hypothetical protein NGM44_07445 [Moraxella sp. FZFQ2102]UTO04876.1 hypothetical protein NKT77_10335 [Moraxella sp. FZLJ2107]UTO21610.1 hypothetical protein NKU06_07150 [Moraxella sp. FZLJ2109]
MKLTQVLLAGAALATAVSATAAEKAGAYNAPVVKHVETTFLCEDGKTVTTQRAPHQDMRVTVDGQTEILERNKRTSWHLWSHNPANNYLKATYSNANGFGWSDNGEVGTLHFPQDGVVARTTCQVPSVEPVPAVEAAAE